MRVLKGGAGHQDRAGLTPRSLSPPQVTCDGEEMPSVRFLANHRGLNHAVNVVRFSPCGKRVGGGEGGAWGGERVHKGVRLLRLANAWSPTA